MHMPSLSSALPLMVSPSSPYSGSPRHGSLTFETKDTSSCHPAVLAAIHEVIHETQPRHWPALGEEGEKLKYLVRNTFIDDMPGTPDSPHNFKREIQSCPGTALLSHHFPRGVRQPGAADIAAALAAHMASQSPGGSPLRTAPTRRDMVAMAVASAADAADGEGGCYNMYSNLSDEVNYSPLGSDLKPWDDDLVAALVRNTAVLVEALTPHSRELQARRVQRSDPVAFVVAEAAAAAEGEATSSAARPQSESPVAKASTTPPGHRISRGLFSPLQLSPVPPGLEEVVRTPLMIRSPIRTPAPTHASEEAYWAAGTGNWIPDAQAMAESFASLVNAEDISPMKPGASGLGYQRRPSSGGKWWHPLEDITEVEEGHVQQGLGTGEVETPEPVIQSIPPWRRPQASKEVAKVVPTVPEAIHPEPSVKAQEAKAQKTELSLRREVKELKAEKAQDALINFVQGFGLDERCLLLLQSLPPKAQKEALRGFLAPADTRNRSAKFVSWVSSKWRHCVADAITFEKGAPPSPEDITRFLLKWNLDRRSRATIEEQCATVQLELISNFAPPADTMNVDAKFTSFANCVSKKMASSLAAEATTQGRRNRGASHSQAALDTLGPPVLLPLPTGLVSQMSVEEFAASWRLDASAEVALRSAAPSIQQAAMSGFKPSARTQDHNKKFVAYLKMVHQYDARLKPHHAW